MSAPFLIHSLFLVLSASLSYIWTTSPVLSALTLQLVAALILVYFASLWALRHRRTTHRSVFTLDLIILTITLLLLVSATGGVASPLFFSLYFLLFAVALLFEIEATLLLTIVLISFLALLPTTDLTNLTHLAELIALVLITPLALFTSHEHAHLLEAKKQANNLSHHLSREESDTLLFLSLNLNRTLTHALDILSTLIPSTTSARLKQSLLMLYQDLRTLHKSAQELESSIDHETDSR